WVASVSERLSEHVFFSLSPSPVAKEGVFLWAVYHVEYI
ncbi:hypothetical protein LCGC14_2194380, partial [marine sediment metagenome]